MKNVTGEEVDVAKLEQDAKALSLKANAIEKETSSWRNGAFGVLGVGALVFVTAIVVYLSAPNSKDLGAFLLGAAGTLWSGAGLVLIYVAFLGQKQQVMLQRAELIQNRIQLELNRQELAETREELKGQKQQLERQAKNSERQLFENTFFIMHSRLREHFNKLRMIGNGNFTNTFAEGNACIKYFVENVFIKNTIKPSSDHNRIYEYNYIFQSKQLDGLALGPYLEQFKFLLYHIRNVDKDINYKFYHGYLKSDLSVHEKMFLILHKNSLITGEFSDTYTDFNTILSITESNLINLFGSESAKIVYDYLKKILEAEPSE